MKKNQWVLVLTGVVIAAALTACSGQQTEDSPASGGTISVQEITADNLEELSVFAYGDLNNRTAEHFTGDSYLSQLSTEQVAIYNVTFEPGCINDWHIHHAESGGGQILMVTAGRGYYQEWGQPAQELNPGDVVNIPEGVKHWHGAAKDSWFQHIAIEVPREEGSTEWVEVVDRAEYDLLP